MLAWELYSLQALSLLRKPEVPSCSLASLLWLAAKLILSDTARVRILSRSVPCLLSLCQVGPLYTASMMRSTATHLSLPWGTEVAKEAKHSTEGLARLID